MLVSIHLTLRLVHILGDNGRPYITAAIVLSLSNLLEYKCTLIITTCLCDWSLSLTCDSLLSLKFVMNSTYTGVVSSILVLVRGVLSYLSLLLGSALVVMTCLVTRIRKRCLALGWITSGLGWSRSTSTNHLGVTHNYSFYHLCYSGSVLFLSLFFLVKTQIRPSKVQSCGWVLSFSAGLTLAGVLTLAFPLVFAFSPILVIVCMLSCRLCI